jgi:plasmid stabilization system protein ParE
MKKPKKSIRNGYKICWTKHALSELELTVKYLNTFWTKKEINRLARELESLLDIIALNPLLFPISKSNPSVRKVTILKYNTLYYRIEGYSIEILSFFSNRQNPRKRKL